MSPGKFPRGLATGAAAMLALAVFADVALADRLLDAAGRSKKSGLPLLVMVSTGAG